MRLLRRLELETREELLLELLCTHWIGFTLKYSVSVIFRVIFTGTVVAVPDVMALTSPGERAECRREAPQRKNGSGVQEGVKGLKSLGVRDLSYRLAFVANSVQV
jgi:hypothetical protein